MTINGFEQLPYSKRIELLSEEDIKSWEFATSSLDWLEEKLEELGRYVDEGERAKPSFEPRFGEILAAVTRGLRRAKV